MRRLQPKHTVPNNRDYRKRRACRRQQWSCAQSKTHITPSEVWSEQESLPFRIDRARNADTNTGQSPFGNTRSRSIMEETSSSVSVEPGRVSKDSSPSNWPSIAAAATCVRRTPMLTPMRNVVSAPNERPTDGLPTRFAPPGAGTASRKIPEAISDFTKSVMVLRLTSNRRARSAREIGCAASTIRKIVRAVSADRSAALLAVMSRRRARTFRTRLSTVLAF